MGILDYALMHQDKIYQADRIVSGINRGIEGALARREVSKPVEINLDTTGIEDAFYHSLGGVEYAISHSMGDVIAAVDESTHQVTMHLDRLGSGIEQLRADFHWLMGDVIWKLELQNRTLVSILEVLQAPLDTQAKELRRRAEFAYLNAWYDEALTDFLESERKNYQDFAVHRSLGNIFLYHRPDLPRALGYFHKAAKYATPRDTKQAAEAHLFAAHVCYRLGDRIQEAIAECHEALTLNPDLLEAHYWLAKCYARAGNEAAAGVSLEVAIRGDARYYEQSEKDPDLR